MKIIFNVRSQKLTPFLSSGSICCLEKINECSGNGINKLENKKGPRLRGGPRLYPNSSRALNDLSGMHGQGVAVFHREDLDEFAAFFRPVVQQVMGAAAFRGHVVLINELEQFRLIS